MFKRTWKNYVFYVKCNDNPLLLVRVAAENKEDAIEYAKDSYAVNCLIYTDDRYNDWHITPKYCYHN